MKKEYQFFVYIMSSISRVIYIGVTNNLLERVEEHKKSIIEGFTNKYRCSKLVYFEEYQYIDQAIMREKQLKKWRREKKIALIDSVNSNWNDLAFDSYIGDLDFSTSSQPIPALLRSK